MAVALQVKGLINIQFVIAGRGGLRDRGQPPGQPHGAATLPRSPASPWSSVATKVMLGKSLQELGYQRGLAPPQPYVAVKAPVFSFDKLTRVDVYLGPEMKSTGEVMGIDPDYGWPSTRPCWRRDQCAPGRESAGLPGGARPGRATPILAGYAELGFEILATGESARELWAKGIKHKVVARTIRAPEPAKAGARARESLTPVLDLIRNGQVQLVINTPTRGRIPERAGFMMRRTATEYRVPCLTSLDTAAALLEVLRARKGGRAPPVYCLQEYLALPRTYPEAEKAATP